MTYVDIPVDRPIEEKISWAHNCLDRCKDTLLNDKKTASLLKRFREASAEGLKEMVEIGLVEECRRCEEEEGGACCGAGIENRYSGTLLLINLLLGVELPDSAPDPKSCFFLGPGGCSLRARHVICVNYICRKITDSIPEQMINDLREMEGEALDMLFILNEQIKSVLREIK